MLRANKPSKLIGRPVAMIDDDSGKTIDGHVIAAERRRVVIEWADFKRTSARIDHPALMFT